MEGSAFRGPGSVRPRPASAGGERRPTDLSGGTGGSEKNARALLASPAAGLSLRVPGKPVHLPVPGPDPVASAGSDCRQPSWGLPGAGEPLSLRLRVVRVGTPPAKAEGEARRLPLTGCSAPWTRSRGGRTPSRWRYPPRGPVCRPAEVGPCQQEALPRPEQRGRSSEPDPYQAQDEPLSLFTGAAVPSPDPWTGIPGCTLFPPSAPQVSL